MKRTQPSPHLATGARAPAVRDAALKLFAERGYEATTMRAIAAAVGIRAPGLYNHVASKQELLRVIMEATMEGLIAGLAEATASTNDTREQLRRAVEAHVRYHTRHRDEAFVGNREIRSLDEPNRSRIVGLRDTYERNLRDLIDRGKREGCFSVSTARLASYAILEMGMGVATWYREDGELSESSVVYAYGEFALLIVGAR